MKHGPEIQYVFTGIAVADYPTAARWFEIFFGRLPDVIVREDVECMWEIREGAWIYIVLDVERAGKSLVTLTVSDLDSTLKELTARGVVGWSTQLNSGVYRKAVFSDPDGNTITYAELLQAE